MSIINLLKNYNQHKASTPEANLTETEKAKAEEDLFTKCFADWSGTKPDDGPLKAIPRFYFKLPAEDDVLRQKLREESRAVLLERKTRELSSDEELKKLYTQLSLHRSPPFVVDDHDMINFEDFKKVAEQADPKCKPYFRASVFYNLLQDDPFGRISITQFFNYVMRKVWLHQSRIGLSLYDVAGEGYLREHDMDNYINELITTVPQLERLDQSFHSFYICTATRKFFFFLDPMRTGKIKIQDILTSGFLDDIVDLRDETLSKEAHDANWFSAYSALRVYDTYLKLDVDHNGMLSKEELSRYGTGTFTNVFVDRVFQECLTFENEMDYRTYLDFVLALEHKREPQSLQYFFRILDVQNRGYTDMFSLNYFFRAIQEQMKARDQEMVSFADIKNEIFDMVKPADPLKITLQDLIRCGQGDTVINILTDSTGFLTYEYREAIVSDVPEDIEN